MEERVLAVQFPLGPLPVRGFRCPVCGNEVLLGDDAEIAQQTARKLGLFGVEDAQVRTLGRSGNSIIVTLDPHLLQEVFPGAKRGTAVKVGKMGKRIVIQEA